MTWKRIPLRALLEDLAGPWDALNRRLYGGHPLFDSRFVFGLLQHFPESRTRAYALGPVDAPRALVLLEPYRPGFWRLMHRSQAEALPVLIEGRDLEQIPPLMRTISPWTICLDFLHQDPLYSPWNGCATSPLAIVKPHARTASLSLSGTFEAYWHARPKSLRQNIARSVRKAHAELGPLTLRVVEDPAGVRRSVLDFGAMESRSWKAEGGTAITPDNAQGRFYQDVLERFARTGQGLSYELFAGDMVIARQLAIANHDICITLKTTYAEEFGRYSPGRLLDHEMLRLEFDRKRFGRIEFYTKADGLQLQWATESREINHVTCCRSELARRAYLFAAGSTG